MSSPLTVPVDLRPPGARDAADDRGGVQDAPAAHRGARDRSASSDVSKRGSVDADVLIRPRDGKQFAAALCANGWTEVLQVRRGAVLGHSTRHGHLGTSDFNPRLLSRPTNVRTKPESDVDVANGER